MFYTRDINLLFIFFILNTLHADCILMLYSYPLQRPSSGNALEKIVSAFHVVYGGQKDEDAILSKCSNAINCLDKADKEIVSGMSIYHLLIIVCLFN